ncbi:MAG TPA: hypothetical protein VEQ63_00655 [Bryobacteraceae bacterium]|nr:hypothetical protein [Bryobacteraceae bacterium]
MILFFRRRVPPLHRILLVESGDRTLFEKMLPFFYQHCPEIDLVTCFGNAPSSFRGGKIYHTAEYAGDRNRLVAELRAAGYSAIGILCAESPILFKWKWLLAARVPAKLFIINENGDFFWAHYENWRTIIHFVLFRAGLTGSDAVRTISRLIALPFAVLFLLLYTALVHTRRALRS